MATLTINGRGVTVDDGFLSLSHEEQQDAVEHIANNLPADKPKEASGFAAGIVHGGTELARGIASTAKRFAGVGDGGKQLENPNYVPANVTNGSWNPVNWSPSQIPQKVAESLPTAAAAIPAASAGAKIGKRFGTKGALVGGLIGATLGGWLPTAGDTAREAAVTRTGDANAEPSTGDLVRGGATAAAASAANALLPTRFVPGMTKLNTVGTQGAFNAVQRYLATTGIGAAGAAASDAMHQAGMTVGTDTGLTVDPSRLPEVAVGGAVTAGAMGVPKLAAENLRAYALREFGGANTEATKNYATRLDTAGDGSLGNPKRDAAAHETVRSDLRNELRNATAGVRKSTQLAPEVDNALRRAQSGEHLTPKDIALIESGTASAPDGANAAYLARTLRVAQLAQDQGSYRGDKWAGGISGALDKNVLPYLNPLKSVTGLAASGLGVHLWGAASPQVAAGVVGAYGLTRTLDSLTGMRSPAKSFAEHFADRQAQLRLQSTPQVAQATSAAAKATPPAPVASPWGPRPPVAGPTGPQVAPPAAPQAPQGPWGSRPLPTTSVPQVQPSAPQAPAPRFNPMALAMLKQSLKQGLPEDPQPAPPPEPTFSPMALSMLKQTLNQGLPPEPPSALAGASASESTDVPKDVMSNTKRLMSALKHVQKLKDASLAPTGEAADLGAAATPKIKKVNGKVKVEGERQAARQPFEPLPEEKLYPRDISPEAYAAAEADAYLGPNVPRGRRENYMASAEETARTRNGIIADMKAQYPQYRHAFDGLLRQLHKIGGKHERALDAVHHYANLLPTDVGTALIAAFK
ncbi:hypothetical protein [Bradyrhizobium sp. USDA 4508]